MSTVVGIGVTHEMEGFALIGVRVIPAASDAEVTAAWAELESDVGLVILSADAERQLEAVLDSRADVLTVVMP
jgi:vacuolar-type H+-ATPase subunit F/Vma7